MKTKKLFKFIIISFASLFCLKPNNTYKAKAAEAFSLCGVFGDHMILQAHENIKVWGWGGTVGEEVTVSFNGQTKTGTIANSGWEVYLDEMEYTSTGSQMTISSGSSSITLSDVNVGEVMFISGQSNVAITFAKIYEKNPEVLNEYRSFNNFNNIRIYTPKWGGATSETIHTYPYSSWLAPTKINNCTTCSALAVSLALNLQAKIGNEVKVGVIEASTGGSCIESWLSSENLKNHTYHCIASDRSIYYNNMVSFLKGYKFGGVFWYQGEHCVDFADKYKEALPILINQYRVDFENPELPVFVFELPGIDGKVAYGNNDSYIQKWVDIRNAQQEVAESMDNVYGICISDTGEISNDPDCIHPADKWKVGDRAAGAYFSQSMKLTKDKMLGNGTYGLSDNVIAATYTNGNLVLETSATSLTCKDEKISGFTIHYKDGTNEITTFSIDGKNLRTTTLKKVQSVDYMQTDKSCAINHVYNENGTPIRPFKSISVEDLSEELTVNYYDGNNLLKSISIDYGSTLDKFEPTKTGFVFSGWYYDKEFTNKYLNDKLTSDTNLYAKFIEVSDPTEENDEDNSESKKGCLGSITSVSILTTISLIFPLLLLIKRKEQ